MIWAPSRVTHQNSKNSNAGHGAKGRKYMFIATLGNYCAFATVLTVFCKHVVQFAQEACWLLCGAGPKPAEGTQDRVLPSIGCARVLDSMGIAFETPRGLRQLVALPGASARFLRRPSTAAPGCPSDRFNIKPISLLTKRTRRSRGAPPTGGPPVDSITPSLHTGSQGEHPTAGPCAPPNSRAG